MSRNVLVTGGGTGIGRAIAARFAAEGDQVVITGRTRPRLEQSAAELGPAVRAVVCDHSRPDRLARLRDHLPDVVHVIVNNAGGNPFYGRPTATALTDIADAWSYVFRNNVLATVLTTEALLPRVADGGALVHIGSTAMVAGTSPLAAAKAGLASWNVALVDRVAERRIVTNVLAPGFTSNTAYFNGTLTQEQHDRMAASAPLGAAMPEDIAGVAYFLASPDARHITGQVIFANGGSHRTR